MAEAGAMLITLGQTPLKNPLAPSSIYIFFITFDISRNLKGTILSASIETQRPHCSGGTDEKALEWTLVILLPIFRCNPGLKSSSLLPSTFSDFSLNKHLKSALPSIL